MENIEWASLLRTTAQALLQNAWASPIEWCERGVVPDALVRLGIRSLIQQRQSAEKAGARQMREARLFSLLQELHTSPIAIETAQANIQHYEVPAQFFALHPGARMKYSSCYFPSGTESISQAETAMLELCAARAELEDGQRILDLGCGWGSMSFWLAERFPADFSLVRGLPLEAFELPVG